jgi:hypothetical protein
VYLVAIAHVWARGSIFREAREHGGWPELLDCPLCSGFWIGVLGHLLFLRAPAVVAWLGIGSIVGTLSLATYGAIRRI